MTRYTRGGLADVTRAWTAATRHWANSLLEAHRATLAGLGVLEDIEVGDTKGTAYREPEWSFERSAEDREDLGEGDTVRFTKRLDEEDVVSFATASGDTNRLHLDDDFAEQTRFGGRIVHGTLVGGLISAALARLPGLTIYLSQDLQFRNPVEIGQTLTAEVEIIEDLGDGRYRLRTDVFDDDADQTVIEGEAVVLVDSLPDGVSDPTLEQA
ncbi:MAG: MaoC family dehydratase [Halodesulfurarchaeum sp.]